MWPACCAPVGNSEAQRGLARQQGTTSQTACQALLHTGTIPDPVVQAQCRQMDEETAEAGGFCITPRKGSIQGSRRQSGVGFDPDFSQFPNDFGYIDRLWLFTELIVLV